MLSEKAVKEYKEIYKQEFGIELSDEEARDEAEKMIRMFRVIYRPIPKEASRKRMLLSPKQLVLNFFKVEQ